MINKHPKYFTEVREDFKKYGTYCRHIEGSYNYIEFWKEETKKCMNGFTYGGMHIPGPYYYFLNYTEVEGVDEATQRRIRSFPDFKDVQLEYFRHLERARKLQKGFIFVKPRRIGASFMSGATVSHEYSFYQDSKSFIGAFQKDLAEYTMRMALNNLNFLDLHTPWGKERNPNKADHVIARYKRTTDNKVEVWDGFMSEIASLTFKDNPFASVGKSANIFIFEEAGKFDNIISSYNISEPTWKAGEDLIGIPIIQGTGGDMEGGTEGFAEMYYNPDKYNLLAFENIWDIETSNKICGWFIPGTKGRDGTYKDPYGEHPEWKGKKMIDEFGNSIEDIAKQSILDLRTRVNQGIDPKAKIDAITQFPLVPQEAFLQSHVNRFPTLELRKVMEALTDNELDKHHIGELSFEGGVLKWVDIQGVAPYREYPVKKPEPGFIEIYEPPRPEDDGIFTINRYIAGIDPYRYDNATTDSVGCILVYDRLTQRIVAEYTGRPDKTDTFYEICRKLLLYYQATAMYESNITGLYHHFEKKKALHLLADTPFSLRDRNTWKTNTNTSKGIIATKPVIDKGLEFIENWLLEHISEESEVFNYERIRSIGFLKELIAWNPDPRSNFDRISAFQMVMWYDRTLTDFKDYDAVMKTRNNKYGNYFNKFKQNQDHTRNLWDKHFAPDTTQI